MSPSHTPPQNPPCLARRASLHPVLPAVRRRLRWLALGSALALAAMAPASRASTAYGSINNFDVVNDTGHECHGFEIELEDIATTDITYTFDWNHYSKSRIFAGTTAAGKPATFVRWESARNADGSWAAYTAIPSGPIAPTDGHQFTNPSVNFGGEHFGTGYTMNPTAVRYFWLYDDGTGKLVRGPEVMISTPVFNYAPPVANVPAQVQAVIVPPAPEVPPAKEFGEPMWVKEIRTTTHNVEKIKLRDLVSDDPNDPNDKNWRNGEPDEVEVEWQLMQVDFKKADGGANGELAAAPEPLGNQDEVVTRRYEFFKYVGPIDNETGEAMADSVAADNVHGKGTKTINGVDVDLTKIEIVGEYIGAQMAAFDAQGGLGLIDNVPDADLNAEYPARTVIVAGALPFTATTQGELPAGMNFDPVSGVLSGTPTEAGTFTFSITANDGGPAKTQTYSFKVIGEAQPPLEYVISTTAAPVAGGLTTGDATYLADSPVTVNAVASAGYRFVNWTDNGVPVSTSASFSFTAIVNRALTANFVAVHNIAVSAAPANLGSATGGGSFDGGTSVTVTATPAANAVFVNWTENGAEVSTAASYTFTASASRTLVANFAPASVDIAASASPANAGAISGTGAVTIGSNVTLTATANAGFAFVRWTEAGAEVSTSASYSFTAAAARTLVAEFASTVVISTASSPANGGSTAGGGTFASGANVTVTASAASGFTFVNWLEGNTVVSTSASLSFAAAASRTLTATFQPVNTTVTLPGATFQGLIGTVVAANADTSGVITLSSVAGSRTVSGSVQLGENKVSFRTAVDAAGHALVTFRSKVLTSVDLQYAETSGFTGTVVTPRGTAPFAARVCPYTARNPLVGWAGDYTHVVGFPRVRRLPLPVGVGTHTITDRGAVRLAGKLSDGTTYSAASLVTDVNHFALYDATKLGSAAGFLVGDVTLANTGSLLSGSPMTWKPANATPAGRFQFYFDAFARPARGQALLQVDPGVHNLNVMAFNPIGGLLAGWELILKPNGSTTDLRTGPGAISLRADNRDGTFDGKFSDGAATRSFTGVVWQSSGQGFAVIPGSNDAASLTLQAIYTGP